MRAINRGIHKRFREIVFADGRSARETMARMMRIRVRTRTRRPEKREEKETRGGCSSTRRKWKTSSTRERERDTPTDVRALPLACLRASRASRGDSESSESHSDSGRVPLIVMREIRDGIPKRASETCACLYVNATVEIVGAILCACTRMTLARQIFIP